MQRLHRRQIPLHHTDDKAAGNIDDDDNNSGDGVPFHELRCTVHRPVEIRLPLDFPPSECRFCISDRSLIEIRIDGHLFTGHSVQREAGRDLRHAFRTFGDDNELNDN